MVVEIAKGINDSLMLPEARARAGGGSSFVIERSKWHEAKRIFWADDTGWEWDDGCGS